MGSWGSVRSLTLRRPKHTEVLVGGGGRDLSHYRVTVEREVTKLPEILDLRPQVEGIKRPFKYEGRGFE